MLENTADTEEQEGHLHAIQFGSPVVGQGDRSKAGRTGGLPESSRNPISRVRRGEQPRRCWANLGPSRSWPEPELAARRRSAVPLRRHVQRSGRRGGRNPLVGCLGDQVDNPLIGLPDDATGRSGVCVRL